MNMIHRSVAINSQDMNPPMSLLDHSQVAEYLLIAPMIMNTSPVSWSNKRTTMRFNMQRYSL